MHNMYLPANDDDPERRKVSYHPWSYVQEKVSLYVVIKEERPVRPSPERTPIQRQSRSSSQAAHLGPRGGETTTESRLYSSHCHKAPPLCHVLLLALAACSCLSYALARDQILIARPKLHLLSCPGFHGPHGGALDVQSGQQPLFLPPPFLLEQNQKSRAQTV